MSNTVSAINVRRIKNENPGPQVMMSSEATYKRPGLLVQTNTVRMEQHRRCTYNVTLRRVRATITAVGKQQALYNLSVCL
jgi:hypothetical protein